MATTPTKAFIQARMNSSRYPGKSLAPLGGKPVIDRVIERVSLEIPLKDVIVLTTTDQPEEPLVSYLDRRGIEFMKGHPANVFKRFTEAIEEYPCEQFFRICGDSPFLEPTLFEHARDQFVSNDYDIVTNVLQRDFPKGKSVELLDANIFTSVDESVLTENQLEHATKYFYDNSEKFDILDITCPVDSYERETYAVDTLDDLKMLEKLLKRDKLKESQFQMT